MVPRQRLSPQSRQPIRRPWPKRQKKRYRQSRPPPLRGTNARCPNRRKVAIWRGIHPYQTQTECQSFLFFFFPFTFFLFNLPLKSNVVVSSKGSRVQTVQSRREKCGSTHNRLPHLLNPCPAPFPISHFLFFFPNQTNPRVRTARRSVVRVPSQICIRKPSRFASAIYFPSAQKSYLFLLQNFKSQPTSM